MCDLGELNLSVHGWCQLTITLVDVRKRFSFDF